MQAIRKNSEKVSEKGFDRKSTTRYLEASVNNNNKGKRKKPMRQGRKIVEKKSTNFVRKRRERVYVDGVLFGVDVTIQKPPKQTSGTILPDTLNGKERMYVRPNYKTKKELKEAIARGDHMEVFQPNNIFGTRIPDNGTVTVEGPHYPKPHTWRASVTIKDGKVIGAK